jgi:hypothetical protein
LYPKGNSGSIRVTNFPPGNKKAIRNFPYIELMNPYPGPTIKKRIAILVFISVIGYSISGNAQPAEQVGDISFDPLKDDSTFVLCNPHFVLQYYNTPRAYYKDHKNEISDYFNTHFKAAPAGDDQTGYLTIKFIINCNGMTGRFRLFELDSSYHAYHFSEVISEQLLHLAKELKGWEPASYKDKKYDSYQYITFRLKKGKIISISP